MQENIIIRSKQLEIVYERNFLISFQNKHVQCKGLQVWVSSNQVHADTYICRFIIIIANIEMEIVLFIMMLFFGLQIVTPQCDKFQSNDLLQSGTYSLTQTNIQQASLKFLYSLQLNFNKDTNRSLQIAISTKSIKQYHPSDGINYYVKGSESLQPRKILLEVFVEKEKSWTQIKIAYLISQNPNFIVGFVFDQADPFELFIGIGKNQTATKKLPSGQLKLTEQYGIQIFISGVSTKSSQFILNIFQKKIDPISSSLIITYQKTFFDTITNIYFNYVIYLKNQPLFSFDAPSLSLELIEGPKMISNEEIISTKFSICRVRNCLQNQVLVGKVCECQVGFIKANNVCRKECGTNAVLDDSNRCICLQGYKKINDICQKCRKGQYFDQANKDCFSCSAFCMKCFNNVICDVCQPAFELKTEDFFGLKAQFCENICGDAKKSIIEECDDGNTRDGDGCSSECKLESEWSCYGGTPMTPSKCSQYSNDHTYIEVSRTLLLSNRAALQFYLTSLPPCFIKQQSPTCSICPQLFSVTILQSQIQMQIMFEYFGNRRFILTFSYPNQKLLNPFSFTLKFNENIFKSYPYCLLQDDLKPQISLIIDPAST